MWQLLVTTFVCLFAASVASGDWIAYNDCVPEGSVNAAKTTLINPAAGTSALKNFDTGAALAAKVTVVNNGAVYGGSGPDVDFSSGTDAYNAFNGKVDFKPDVMYYGDAGWNVELVFTDLTAGMKYTLVSSLERGRTGSGPYTDRWTKISILDADDSNYAASAGAWKVDDSAVSIQCLNDVNGYVAGWTDIVPGADNDFTIRFAPASNTPGTEIPTGESQNGVRGYGPGGFMLVEQVVPEPATLALLALGGLALLRRRRRR